MKNVGNLQVLGRRAYQGKWREQHRDAYMRT
jgi:hypothetical protein